MIFYIVDSDKFNLEMGTHCCVFMPTMARATSHDATFKARRLSGCFLTDNNMQRSHVARYSNKHPDLHQTEKSRTILKYGSLKI